MINAEGIARENVEIELRYYLAALDEKEKELSERCNRYFENHDFGRYIEMLDAIDAVRDERERSIKEYR